MHLQDLGAGNYSAAFGLMTAAYRSRNPSWLTGRAAADPGINILSIGSPRYTSGGANVPVNFYARDRHPTPGSDTQCREFQGTVHLIRQAGSWRYDPMGNSLSDTVYSDNSNCPSSTIIGGAQGNANRPKAVYFANSGLTKLHFSLWSNAKATAAGTLQEGAAACGTYPHCPHPRLKITFSHPAMLACAKSGKQVLTFTHAVLSTGIKIQLDAVSSGLCIWYLTRKFGAG